MELDSWYLEHLVCPQDHHRLHVAGDTLECTVGHVYPVVDGIPVMLWNGLKQTIELSRASLGLARDGKSKDGLYLDSMGLSEEEKQGVVRLSEAGVGEIDPAVSYLIAATNGIAYKHLIGRLQEYPIPDLPVPAGHGEMFLDVGCSWGRWCIAAARKGYYPVGIDPSLGAVMAARRVAAQMGVQAKYLVDDARFLPFESDSMDRVFSYSVVQHFSRENARRVVAEIGRALKSGGDSYVQMPTVLGLRCLYHQARRGFYEAVGFDVRYWSVPALRRLFSSSIGPTNINVDCFFGIGWQHSDLRFMPVPYKWIMMTSEALRHCSVFLPLLKYVADSVYVSSVKQDALS